MSTENAPSAPLPTAVRGDRIVRPRPALRNGRAVAGALLIAVAGLGAFATAHRAGAAPATRWVVVARPVAPGARLTADDLTVRAMTLDPAVADNAFADPAPLVGAVTLAPLGTGQLVQRAEVAPATAVGGTVAPGHELTIPVPADRLPVGLRRGEPVAVLATYGTGTDARTVVTVQRATVLAVGDAGDSLAARGTARLTVALPDPDTVVETAHAAQVAELTIVRATQSDQELPPAFTTESVRAKTLSTTAVLSSTVPSPTTGSGAKATS